MNQLTGSPFSARAHAVTSEPFILTLEMDGESFARLNELRRRHFPPERNQVPAHITMFHQLPGDRARDIKAYLKLVVARTRPMSLEVAEAKMLDSGVAFFIRSPALQALRTTLEAEWSPWLTDQDRTGFRPHVTIQNKASAEQVEAARRELSRLGRPPPIRGKGLHLWRYRGGPWADVQLFRFAR